MSLHRLNKTCVAHTMDVCVCALTRTVCELQVLAFDDFGATRIKQLGVSPDAFAQMAIQLTQYRLSGRCVGTYESGAMRHFLHGRTETVRCDELQFGRAAPLTNTTCGGLCACCSYRFVAPVWRSRRLWRALARAAMMYVVHPETD